jgi:hypothetical protein
VYVCVCVGGGWVRETANHALNSDPGIRAGFVLCCVVLFVGWIWLW